MSTPERSFIGPLLAIVLALLATFASGCAATNTQTARQLDSGELVVAGTIDMPGYLFVPRLSGHLSYGYGPGDVTARAGSALLANFIGVGTRAYPTDWLNISVDADLVAVMVPFSGGPDDWMPMLVFTPRLYTSAAENRLFYGGLQSNIVIADPLQMINVDPRRLALFGLMGGIDWRSKKGLGVQAELVLSPVGYHIDERALILPFVEDDQGPMSAVELTLGFYWSRPPKGRALQAQLTATPFDEDEELE